MKKSVWFEFKDVVKENICGDESDAEERMKRITSFVGKYFMPSIAAYRAFFGDKEQS